MHDWDLSRRGALQEVHPSRIFETMTKWSVDIDDKKMVPLYLRWALRDCMAYPPGPIALGLTLGALGLIKDPEKLIGELPKEAMASPSPTQADPAAVDRAVMMLLEAKRPVLVAGDGVYWADAAAELKELAELLSIPVNMRRMARGAITEDHPLAVGGAYRADFWTDADVMLLVGLKVGWFERHGRTPAWPSMAKRIVIHESATDGWTPLPTAESIIGNPKLVLRQMINCIKGYIKKRTPRQEWLERLERCRQAYEKGLEGDEAEYQDEVPIHPWVLAREVARFLDPDTTVILDSLLCSGYLTDKIKASFPGQILDSGEAGSFGHGIGMGIGAQLARPGRQVLVLTSDTSMGMGGSDVETALRYNLPVVYVVCNTGSVVNGVDCWFQGQVEPWQYLPDIRYDRMYELIGCHGEYVTRPDQITPALYRAFNSGKTAVVNIVVNNRVVLPWFESLSFRLGVIVHQLDVSRIPEPFRTYLLEGRTPELDKELRRAGIPRSKTRKMVLAYDRAICW
jgi:acetolactate synthase-1/2/3 large subunit